MRRPSRPGLSLVLAFCAGMPLAAQDLESIGRKNPFSCSGGISFNQVFCAARGSTARRSPYRYIASGSLNLSLYGWTVPLSFTAANHNTTFTQPFNRYAVHPTWKWIRAHAGYTALSFSPYTVNGHNFLGGAVELAPGNKWRFSALYGRFIKAVDYDTLENNTPAYQRYGYGFKASYGTGQDLVAVTFFRAADERRSIAAPPDSIRVMPAENVVASIAAGKSLFRHFLLKAELAASALSRDTRAGVTENKHFLARSGIFFTPRLSSAYYHAFKTSFDYQHNAWLLGVAYERIDPGYRTFGAYYFNSDLENVTVNGSAALLEGKLNMAVSTGVEHDNLAKQKVSTMRRVVGSVNLTYTPDEKINLAASYSTFQSYTNIRSQFETINQLTPYENADTLNFTQISRNASLSGMWTLRQTEDSRQHISLQLAWQDAAQQQGDADPTAGARFYNLTTTYAVSVRPQDMRAAVAFNTTINDSPFLQTCTAGPTVSLTRSFLQRRFCSTLSSTYSRTYSNGVKADMVFNCRWSGLVTIRNRHNLQVSAVMVNRASTRETAQQNAIEFTTTVGYRYAFSVTGRRGKN